MARPLRTILPGWVYHTLNRANAKAKILESPSDFDAFETVLEQAHERYPIRILAYCVMPNHWHFVLWPSSGPALSAFLKWLTVTHTRRWHLHRDTVGCGHLYQGRFKSFPVSTDEYFFGLCRYVERNPVRAGLVERAEHWRWGSLWRREYGTHESTRILSDWPVPRPADWVEIVNQPQTERELAALRYSVKRGRPFGNAEWVRRTARALGLESTQGTTGRPRKRKNNGV